MRADLGNLTEGSGVRLRYFEPLIKPKIESISVSGIHPLGIALAAPTRVSPAAATEQKHYQKNNQYGFHVGTSVVIKELDWPL